MTSSPGRACTGRVFRLAALLAGIVLLSAPRLVRAGSAEEPATRLPALAVEARLLDAAEPLNPSFTVDDTLLAGRSRITFADALRGTPGLLLQEHFGGFEPPRISIRGSGLQSAPLSRGLTFLLEGLPLNLADGSFNLAVVDPALVERLEVFRGASGSGDASAVLGGAIELRRPARPANGTAIAGYAGSYGLAGATASAHSSRRDLALDATVDYAGQDGYRDHSAQARTGVFVSARKPNPTGAETALSVYHVHATYEVPGPLTMAAAAATPRSVTSDILRDQPSRTSEATQLALRTEQQNPDLSVQLGASWLHSTDWFRQLQANGISDSGSDDVALHGDLIRRFNLANASNRLRGSATYLRGWRQMQRYVNDRGAAARKFADDQLRATTFTVEAEDAIDFSPALAASVGVTGLAARRDSDDRMPAGSAPRTTQPWSASSAQPHAEVAWTPVRNVHWHAGVSRASEPPTFDDLLVVSGTSPNLQLRPQALATQRSTTWQLGANGSRGALDWDVTAYTADWSNEILRLADARGLPRGAVNARTTRHRGVEAFVRWRIIEGTQKLRLVATGNWSRFTFVGDPVFGGNRLAGTPPHLGTAELQYESAAGPFAAAGGEWTAGATGVDHADRLSFGGHATATVRAGWHGRTGWRAGIEVRNLFDRTFIASTAGVLDVARNPAATSVFLPSIGRTIILRIDWSLP